MKTWYISYLYKCVLLVLLTGTTFFSNAQDFSAGINTESPNPNAVLHLVSPNGNQGLMVPKLTTTQRNAMSLAASDNGLLVFDSDENVFYFWFNPNWIVLSTGSGQTLSLSGDNLSILNGNSIDLSTVDNQSLTLSGNTLTIDNGNSVDLSSVGAGNQDLSLSGNSLSLSGDASPVDLSGFLDDTDDQTLTLTGTSLAISEGNSVDLSGIAGDNQDLTLSGNTLSLTNDATTVDLSSFLDNTDAQTLSLAGTDLTIADGNTVDLSGIAGDNQDLELASNILTLTNDDTPVDLSAYLDNTDAQTLSLAGTDLSISDGNTIDLSGIAGDNQDLDLAGNTLSLTNDGTTVDLSGYLDNTDEQDLTLAGNTLSLTNDATPVDLSGYLDNTDAQTLSLAGTDLTISDGNTLDLSGIAGDNQDLDLVGNTLSLTNDGTTVDLSGYLDNTDEQNLSFSVGVISLSGSAGTVDLSAYDDDGSDDITTADLGTGVGQVLSFSTANTLPALDGSALTNVTSTNFSGTLAGDVTGTQGATAISAIQAEPLNTSAVADGDILQYVSTEWVNVPNTFISGGDPTGAGDIGGTYTGGLTVDALQAEPLNTSAVADGDILQYVSTEWVNVPNTFISGGDPTGAGDIGGTYTGGLTVDALQAEPLNTSAVADGDILQYVSTEWVNVPNTFISGGDPTGAGDIGGTYTGGLTVDALQAEPLNTSAVADGDILQYVSTEWVNVPNTFISGGDPTGAGDIGGTYTGGLTVDALQAEPLNTSAVADGDILQYVSTEWVNVPNTFISGGDPTGAGDIGGTYTGGLTVDALQAEPLNTSAVADGDILQYVSTEWVNVPNTFISGGDPTGAGDIGGTYTGGLTVDALQSEPLNTSAVADGDILQYVSTEWVNVPNTFISGGDPTGAGDIGGTYTGGLTVDALQAEPLNTSAVADGDILQYVSTEWVNVPNTFISGGDPTGAGDIGGTYTGGLTVDALQAEPLNTSAVADGDILQYVSTEWVNVPNTFISGGDPTGAGDIGGTYTGGLTVDALQAEPLNTTAVTDGDILQYVVSEWVNVPFTPFDPSNITTDLTFENSAPRNIIVNATATGNGQNLTVQSGISTTSGIGGDLNLYAGGSSDNFGGNLNIQAGLGDTNGGITAISGGDASGITGTGGDVTIDGGDGGSTGSGGIIRLTPGFASTTQNIVEINANSALKLPAGAAADQPSAPIAGMIRFNTDGNFFEGNIDGSPGGWIDISAGFSLPVLLSDANDSQYLFSLEQTGLDGNGEFIINNATNATPALSGITNGTGPGGLFRNTGSGPALAVDGDLEFPVGTSGSIIAEINTAGPGDDLFVAAGTSNTSNGGNLTLSAGAGLGGSGGALTLNSGLGNSGGGGQLELIAGDGSNGGTIEIKSGNSNAAGSGGDIILDPGTGSGGEGTIIMQQLIQFVGDIDSDITFRDGIPRTISSLNSTTAAGDNLNIAAGNTTFGSPVPGGNLTLSGGTSTNGNGGNVTIIPGTGTADGFVDVQGDMNITGILTAGGFSFDDIVLNDGAARIIEINQNPGVGDALTIKAGDGTGAAGGDLFLSSGNGNVGSNVTIDAVNGGTGAGGNINLNASSGFGPNNGGIIDLKAGGSVDGTGGEISLSGGISSGTGKGGSINLIAGDNSGTGDGGDIILTTGFGGSGITGLIHMQSPTALIVPTGTEAEKPGTAVAGMLRFNTTNGAFEGNTDGSAGGWFDITGGGGGYASAAYETLDETVTLGSVLAPPMEFGSGNFQLGAVSPSGKAFLSAASHGGQGSEIRLSAAQGTQGGGEAQLLDGDLIGEIVFDGYHNGGSYSIASTISVQASEDWNTATNTGTNMLFHITPNSTNSLTEVLNLSETGIKSPFDVEIGQNIYFPEGSSHVIGVEPNSGAAGDNLTIHAGDFGGGGTGGTLTLTGGQGEDGGPVVINAGTGLSLDGGNVEVIAGNGTNNGGDINLTAGTGSTNGFININGNSITNGNASITGDIDLPTGVDHEIRVGSNGGGVGNTLTVAAGDGSGGGGVLRLYSGSGPVGGDIIIESLNGGPGAGGNVSVIASAGLTNNPGGNVNIDAGAGGTGGANGGDIVLTPGVGGGGSPDGEVTIDGNLNIVGSERINVFVTNTDYTVMPNDRVIIYDGAGGDVITFPAAVDFPGMVITVTIKQLTTTLSITVPDDIAIPGSNTYNLDKSPGNVSSATFVSDGVDFWALINKVTE